LIDILERAGEDTELVVIKHLTKYYKQYQLYEKSPGRFRFTLKNNYEFNYSLVIDIIYLDNNKPMLYVIDSFISFQATRFLKDISAKTT
jgi:hypothetical protein